MSIFGVLEVESVVQVGDKTRLSAVKSFVTKGNAAIIKVYIKPEASADYIDVTGSSYVDWYLDWVYAGSSRAVVATVKCVTTVAVTADPMHVPPIVGVDEVSSTTSANIQVNTSTDDMLFSGDSDLTALEPDILKWVPDGRASWLNIHRAAQEKIMDWLNKSGLEDSEGEAFTKADILEVDEVKFWSRDWTLAMIYKGIQNAKDDVFADKAKFYFSEADKGSHRAKLRLDTNHDGEQKSYETANMTSKDLVRQ